MKLRPQIFRYLAVNEGEHFSTASEVAGLIGDHARILSTVLTRRGFPI